MEKLLAWVKAHRRLLILKATVAAILVIAHHYPDSRAALAANLIWLLVF
jgi:hypothetical protein